MYKKDQKLRSQRKPNGRGVKSIGWGCANSSCQETVHWLSFLCFRCLIHWFHEFNRDFSWYSWYYMVISDISFFGLCRCFYFPFLHLFMSFQHGTSLEVTLEVWRSLRQRPADSDHFLQRHAALFAWGLFRLWFTFFVEWKTTEKYGKWWKTVENYKKWWKMMENYGKLYASPSENLFRL